MGMEQELRRSRTRLFTVAGLTLLFLVGGLLLLRELRRTEAPILEEELSDVANPVVWIWSGAPQPNGGEGGPVWAVRQRTDPYEPGSGQTRCASPPR